MNNCADFCKADAFVEVGQDLEIPEFFGIFFHKSGEWGEYTLLYHYIICTR